MVSCASTCESMSHSTKEENEFTYCITQSFQLVYYIISSKIISLCHITEPLLLYCSLYTQFPCYFYQVCFIQNIKLYMFIVENREIQKSMMKKITLMKKINIIHNSTSGSIFGVFSLKYIHIYIYVAIYIIYTCRMEKAMAPHSSILAWKIPWTEEPRRLQSMGS